MAEADGGLRHRRPRARRGHEGEPVEPEGPAAGGGRQVHAGQRGRQAGKVCGKGGNGRGSRARLQAGISNSDEDPKIWTILARALVRHEDSIQALRQDTGIVFWARYDPPSIIPVLQASAKKWQGRAELAQGKLGNMPLREVLFVGILNTLVNTLTALDKDPEQIQKCQSSGWLNPEKCWVYQRWDRDQRVLVIDDSRTPKSSPQVLQDAQEMLRLAVMGHVIHRFHATKKLDMCSSGVLTLVMDLSVREPAGMDLHRLLMDYQGSSVFQLIGLQYRRDSLKRSPLVELLQKQLERS